MSLTRAELARAAELTDEELGSLEEYGLVVPHAGTGDRVLFDEDALAVARIAAGFMRHGIEPRHLRMYRAFAEREARAVRAGAAAVPPPAQPEAQARTAEALGELAGLGRRLRTVMLRQAVRRSTRRLTRADDRCRARSCSTPTTIAATVERLGAEIEADHPDGVVLVAVLKGALLFVADLARAIRERAGRGRLHVDLEVRARLGPGARSCTTSAPTSAAATSCSSRTSSTPA